MNAFDNFQVEVNEWQRKTFPESTKATVLTHLYREAKELREKGTPDEAADVLLLLIAFADKAGFSLFDAARDKFEICKARKWGQPDAQGVREHVRDLEMARPKKWYGTCLDCGADRPCGNSLHEQS